MTNPDDTHLTIINASDSALAHVGQVANEYAARNDFADYLSRKADNTIRRQAADLARFVEFLSQVGEQAGLSSERHSVSSRKRLLHFLMDRHLTPTPGTV